MTQEISGLGEVLDAYDGLVVDLWGVMHNGKALFPAAVEALRLARSTGKSITLLSNAPRRKKAALAGLGRFDFDTDLIDDLVTSGEAAWQAINSGLNAPWGSKCFFFGAPKDVGIQDGLDSVHFVDDLDQADWILNVGPDAGFTSADPFRTQLEGGIDRTLPMVCANPDLIVQRGNETEICAGAVATLYAKMGGQVIWFGKPYEAAYKSVFDSAGLPPSKLLAIGDSFKTDIRGANAQDMDVMYVNTGIHANDVGPTLQMDRVSSLSQANQAYPTYVCKAFQP